MYQQFYGFKAKPFESVIEANHYFLGRPQRHVVTLVHNGLRNGRGIVVITGSSGIGKSSFVEFFRKEQTNSRFTIASISAEESDDLGLLYLILSGYKQDIIDYKTPNLVEQVETFVQYQIKLGNSPLLIIDDAHKLNDQNLEILQQLTQFENDGKLHFQVLLIGDEKLNDKLNSESHKLLKNNIVSSGEIEPMSYLETKKYVLHRLKRVGWVNNPVISDDVILTSQEETGGIPAKINSYFDLYLHNLMIKLPDPVNLLRSSGHQYNAQNLLSTLIELRNERRENLSQSLNKKTQNKPKFRNSPANHVKNLRKKTPTGRSFWFNWQTAGVIVGSYLLSVVIAGTTYYFDGVSKNSMNEKIMIARK